MSRMAIANYIVSAQVHRPDSSAQFSRAIVLEAAAGEGPNDAQYIYIYFYDPAYSKFGHHNGNSVIVYPPLRDFDHMYHLLQTEKPLVAEWTTIAQGNSGDNLRTFGISTSGDSGSKEPIGEGPRDFT